MNYRRISLFGGPGCGKTGAKALVLNQLKKKGYNIGGIDEWVKDWAYMGVEITPFDQMTVFANQLRKEELTLRSGEDYIVTDSPVFMPIYYSSKYGFREWESLVNIYNWYEEEYPSLNIFLDREGIEYKEIGRWENREEAEIVDRDMKKMMDDHGVEHTTIRTLDEDLIIDHILKEISKGEQQCKDLK